MKRVILKKGEEGRIVRGHPWVYDNEVDRVLEGRTAPAGKNNVMRNSGDGGPFAELLEAGECADIESSRKQYLGRAIVNPNSKIIARVYSPSKEGMDKGFFKRRIREAVQRRQGLFDLSRESARLVFAEADFLPGLVIDRFAGWPLADIEDAVTERPLGFELVQAALGPPRSWLAIQFLAWGMDSRRELILEALEEVLGAMLPPPAGIIEKSAARARELEGLSLREGLVSGSFPAEGIVVFENGLPFAADLLAGQKTGHFLDQRDNRRLAGEYAVRLCAGGGKNGVLRVLDACSYTGGFGLHILRAAAEAGFAAEILAVDTSEAALKTVQKNAALNGAAERVTTIGADVFEMLNGAERKKEKFDLVILDPPAFAKSRTALTEALGGYKEINLRAIRLLRPGGILVSCSCSQALDEIRFKRMIADAAADADRRLIQLDFRFQGPDHPVLAGYDESLYLKCGFYRVL
jgi:23S rRNA (cytosine1962-C5)-methyltransferase